MPAKRKEYDITKNPAYIAGMMIAEKRKQIEKQADQLAKEATKNPSLNPAGKAVFEGYRTIFDRPAVRLLPDPSASARGAKARKSREPKLQQSSSPSRSQLLKTRGTQSSAIRKIIK
jgi:hypothetical protein